jgi:hypothetical protein
VAVGPKLTEREIRRYAARAGVDPERAVAASFRGDWVHQLWERLRAAAIAGEPSGWQRVASARLEFSSTLAFAAATSDADGQAVVTVHLGIVEAVIDCARTITPLTDDPRFHGGRPPDEALREAGLRIAHVLGWLTSVARHPVPTPEHKLSEDAETFARGLSIGAITFVLAHELGHVMSGPVRVRGREQRHARELSADLWAAGMLRRIPNPPRGRSTGLDSVELSPDTTIPGAGFFLSFEGLRQRATAEASAGPGRGPDNTVFEITTTTTHPSPYLRIASLLRDARNVDADGTEAAGIQMSLDGFDALLPYVASNLPSHVLTTTRLRELWREQGRDPKEIRDGAWMTWGDLYRSQIEGLLRDRASKGSLSDTDVDLLEELVSQMPKTGIDTLAAAVAGRLLPPSDPDAAAVHAVARGLPARVENPWLRQAITPAVP